MENEELHIEENLLKLFETKNEQNITLALELQETVKSVKLEELVNIYHMMIKYLMEDEKYKQLELDKYNFAEQILIIRKLLHW